MLRRVKCLDSFKEVFVEYDCDGTLRYPMNFKKGCEYDAKVGVSGCIYVYPEEYSQYIYSLLSFSDFSKSFMFID